MMNEEPARIARRDRARRTRQPIAFGLRREAKHHAAFTRTSVSRASVDGRAPQSGVAAARCRRTPKTSPLATKSQDRTVTNAEQRKVAHQFFSSSHCVTALINRFAK